MMMSRGGFRDEFLAERDIKEPIKIPKLFPEDPDQPYHIPMIEMSEDLAKSLTYEDKLDRSPENINRLIIDGEKQGAKVYRSQIQTNGLPSNHSKILANK
jgi:NTE family protein